MLVNTELALCFAEGHCDESSYLKFWWQETLEVCPGHISEAAADQVHQKVVVFRTEKLSLNSLLHLKIIH